MSAQISIPAGLNLEEEYYAKAVVKAKTSGQVDEARSRNMKLMLQSQVILDSQKPNRK